MSDKPFNTQEEREAAIGKFESLRKHNGWQLIVEILELNIKNVTAMIVAGGEKADMDRLRDKLAVYTDVVNTPDLLIKSFSRKDFDWDDISTDDPFQTAEQLKEDRKNLHPKSE